MKKRSEDASDVAPQIAAVRGALGKVRTEKLKARTPGFYERSIEAATVTGEDVVMESLGLLTEALDTEIKGWLDLNRCEDEAVFAKACLALRNNDGGRIILGLDDKTLHSLCVGRPADLAAPYHPDRLNEIVGKYALPKFGVLLKIKEYEGQSHPEITIPGGIEFPVISRRPSDHGIRQNVVYMRTISHGRVSSSEPATAEDWRTLIDRCFDNREADIGRFFKRHLHAITSQVIQIASTTPPTEQGVSRTESELLLDFGREEFDEAWRSRKQSIAGDEGVQFHGFAEVAACLVSGRAKAISLPELLDVLFVRQPHLTGWPPWADTRATRNSFEKPFTRKGGWEAIVHQPHASWHKGAVDFWRVDPAAKFYLLRTLETDTAHDFLGRGGKPGSLFDWYLVIARTAEIMATAKAFSEALAEDPARASVHFSFRWSGLRGRHLCCWVDPHRDGIGGQPPGDDDLIVNNLLPLDKPNTFLWENVRVVTQALFDLFGVPMRDATVRDIVEKTLQRRQ